MTHVKNPLIAHLDRTLPVDGFNIGSMSTDILKSLGSNGYPDYMSIVTVEDFVSNIDPNEGIFGMPVDSLDTHAYPEGKSNGGRSTTEGRTITGRFDPNSEQ